MCLPFTFAISKNLIFYGIPHVSTIDIQVYEYTVVEQMFGLNVERDTQVIVQYVIA
jgi:hypothetical protein